MSASSSSSAEAIGHLGVVGGGIMGRGIEQVAARAGLRVARVDVHEPTLERTRSGIRKRRGCWQRNGLRDGLPPDQVLDRSDFGVDLGRATGS